MCMVVKTNPNVARRCTHTAGLANGEVLLREKESTGAVHVTEEAQFSVLMNKKDLNNGSD